MREKYQIKGEDWIFGVRYDRKTGKTIFGCRTRFSDDVNDIIESYFLERRRAVKIPKGSRTRWRIRIGLDCWIKGICSLRKSFTVSETKCLGRMTY